MADSSKIDRPWRLALIADDVHTIKVAAAYYALPEKQRGDMDKIGRLSGVDHDVEAHIMRLDVAGLLQKGDPPVVLERLITSYALGKMKNVVDGSGK